MKQIPNQAQDRTSEADAGLAVIVLGISLGLDCLHLLGITSEFLPYYHHPAEKQAQAGLGQDL